ncbi:hypothetical protein BGZ89_000353 [Linnemannia elongata]|nr:hypothetical protein BGZ89_000353 [Linnemannia elongata]
MNPHSDGERSKVSFHHDRPGLHRPQSHQPSPGGSLLTSRRNPRALKKSGYIQCAGALFTDHSASGKMIGSAVFFQAENAEELLRIAIGGRRGAEEDTVSSDLDRDYDVVGNVWEHYEILLFRSADFS